MAQKLDDGRIVSILTSGIRESVGFSDSKLSKERTRTVRYYEGEYPKALHSGNSHYVSLDVYDSVESMKAQLLETFSANYTPVKFAPQGAQDIELAREATEYCNYVVFRQNTGYEIFRTVIHDGLMGRAGVAKVWWSERKKTERQTLTDVSFEQVKAHLTANPDVEIDTAEPYTDSEGFKRVELISKKDLSQVRIEPLPPEEFGISPQAKSIEEAELVFHRQRRSVSSLLKAGYPKKKITALMGNQEAWFSMEPEIIERFEETDDYIGPQILITDEEARRKVVVYECYAHLDVNGDGKSHLYKITMAGNVILDQELCEHKPFVAFVPLPRSHAFWGSNYALLTAPTQDARTLLTRSVIDHALITTNPRWQVVKGGLANPRELMENRLGGIVNVRRPDSIGPLPVAPLNPFVYQTIGLLDADKEERTGISKLSQGLNKDAISKQNSAALVEQLVSISQVRQKIVARNFAEGFLHDLYLLVYHLILENESAAHIIEIAGQYQAVNPTLWPERDEVAINFSLGYGEQEKEAERYAMIDKQLASDPRLQRMYTEQNRYHTISTGLQALGIKDISSYLTNPAKLPPPQPDPAQQADVAVKQADAKVKMASAQATIQKIQLDAQMQAAQLQLDKARLDLETMKVQGQLQIEKDKIAHRITVDATELALQRDADAQGKLQAFAEPTH